MPVTSQCVRHVLLAVIVSVAIGLAPALGQGEAKLTASDGAAYDCFGYSIALSGDTALVGALGDDDNGQGSGSAYVFEKIGAVWTEVAKLTASEGAPGDVFGAFVGLYGDTALVGAYLDDDNGENSGSAYVFQEIAGVWTQVAKLTASDGAAEDNFASSVALSGDTALVGAYLDDDNGRSSGSAYIFEKIGGVWVQTAKLTGSDGAAYDFFGGSIALSGDTALVGAPGDDDNGSHAGSAYIFEKVGGVWTEVGKLTASDGVPEDGFACSVSLSGDTALLGAWGDDDNGSDSGSAYVFERDQGGPDNWGQLAKLTTSDGATGDHFGLSVGLYADTVLVGAPGDDDNGDWSGSAYVFEKIGALWTELGKLTASDGAPGDYFGASVAPSGDAALVGADGDGDNGYWSGSAYVFRLCRGDLDGDWDTDHADLGILLADWGCDDPVNGCAGDLDNDGDTDHSDLGILLADWGCGT